MPFLPSLLDSCPLQASAPKVHHPRCQKPSPLLLPPPTSMESPSRPTTTSLITHTDATAVVPEPRQSTAIPVRHIV